jgi:CheY-like chemotaxis protein
MSSSENSTNPNRRQIEILVVASNPADVLLTEMAFKKAGLKGGFQSVSDGEEALSYVRKEGRYANVTTPDLIFMDLSLPKNQWPRCLTGDQIDASSDAYSNCSCFWDGRP